MHALSGIPPQEALGEALWDVRYRSLPESRKTAAIHNWLKQGLLQLLETGHWQVVERPLRAVIAHASGHEFDVEFVVSSLKTASGYRIVGDCLKPDPAGLPAKATQDAYQSLIEHSLQGVVIFQGRRLVYANEAAAAITGYAQEELLSLDHKALIGLIHPNNQQIAWQYLQEWLSGRKTPLFEEYRYRHPDGSVRWLQVHTTLISRQGKPALQAAFLDVTARQAAQEALRRSLDQERRTREMMLALGEAAQSVLRARTASEVYRVIGEQVRALGFHAVVLKLEPDGGYVKVDYVTYPQEMLQKAEQITALPMLGYRFVPSPGGYYDRIVVEKRAIYDGQSSEAIAEAFGASHRQYAQPAAQALDIKQRIGAPLLIHDQVRGILIVNGNGLREEDVPAVEAFANQAAIALENAAFIAEDQRQREALRALSARLVRIQEAEQARIARELHDETGQTLTAMNLHLTQAIEDLASTGVHSQTVERLTQTRELVEQTTRRIREMCFRLRPSILDEMGLRPALRWLCNWFERQYGVQVFFRSLGADGRLASEVETTLYRVVQEGLTNVSRYAQAQNVSVRLERLPSSVVLTVEDDGVGFDMAALFGGTALFGSAANRSSAASLGSETLLDSAPTESTGLQGMRERVKLVGGTIDVFSQPNEGTRLSVTIPLERG